MLKISISGIRGIWGEDLTPESILSFTRAFSLFVKQNHPSIVTPTVVVGSDTRPTSPVFKSMVCSFLQTFGFKVIDVGVLATPVVSFSVRKLNAQAGIIITASHNPLQWNAFKFVNEKGLFFNAQDMKELEIIEQNNPPVEFSYQTMGSVYIDNSLIDQYLETVLPYFNLEKIRNARFRIIADVINGTASQFFPILMQYLGIEYSIIHSDTSKAFERGAEPKPENLTALKNKVLERRADIGFAFDPDGDRLALVDEHGEAIGENWTLIVSYLGFLKLHNPKNKDIVVNLSTSMLIEQLAQSIDAQVIRTPVGEIHVTSKLLEKNIEFGGEGNGGVIFPQLNPCRDSILAVLFILEYLAVENTCLSSIVKQFKIPTNINDVFYLNKPIDIEKLKSHFLELASQFSLKDLQLDEQDGLRMTYNDGWIQIRLSNTEPLLRIMGESFRKEQQLQMVQAIKSWI